MALIPAGETANLPTYLLEPEKHTHMEKNQQTTTFRHAHIVTTHNTTQHVHACIHSTTTTPSHCILSFLVHGDFMSYSQAVRRESSQQHGQITGVDRLTQYSSGYHHITGCNTKEKKGGGGPRSGVQEVAHEMATEGGCLKCGQWNTCKDPPTHPLDKQPYFAWDQSTERSSILETTNKRCWMLGWWCTRSNKMRRAPFIPTAISNSPSRAGTKHTTVSSCVPVRPQYTAAAAAQAEAGR